MKPKAVIFDLDGTLVDSLEDITVSVNDTLRLFDKPLHTSDQVKANIGDGPAKLMERTFEDDPEVDIDDAIEKYLDFYAKHSGAACSLMPGVEKLLDYLDGRPLAVVTNKIEKFARQNLEKLGIIDRFKIIIGWDTGFTPKPSNEPLLHVCKEFNLAPSDMAMVGDGVPDVQAGTAAGIDTYAMMGGFTTEEKLLAQNPSFTINSMDDLIGLWE